jgi:ribonuclease Y
MQLDAVLIVIILVLAGIAFMGGWLLNAKTGQNKIASAQERAKKIIENAEKESQAAKKEKLLEVKDEWYKKKQEHDAEFNKKNSKLQAYEKQLSSREDNIDRKVELLNKKEKSLHSLERELYELGKQNKAKQEQLAKLLDEENQKLEKIAGLSTEEAKKILMENLVETAKIEASHAIKEIRDQAKSEAKKEAQKIVVQAIQRSASDHSVETTVSVLNIASDEMKGRIIGREGRNIRAFEAATGVDVIVDDTPEAVIISAFDPLRREIAKIALDRLIQDGRIHPARIEEIVEKVQKELDEEIVKVGNDTLLELGVHNVHPEIVKMLGKMKYRTSYGQNVLQHSKEVSYLCGIMAAELGLDPVIAKRAGIFHDIGKSVDRNVEGPHAILGYEIAKKYKENPIVCNAIGSHHEDMEIESAIAVLVQAADAVSGARPGARRESLEGYVKRLEKLEGLAKSFEGVVKTYAIQAGREIRVMVENDKVDDVLSDKLANDIASKIQEEMEYPGQIKVTVIREVRAIAYAK